MERTAEQKSWNDIPAFPRPYDAHSWTGKDDPVGMTLKDYFAGQALIGLINISHQLSEQFGRTISYENIAEIAYYYADAMLEARKK